MRRPWLRRDRGATLVEYALILALVVVASIGAIQFLTRQSEAEVASQADCVSTRPPPPSCQPRAVTTSTTLDPPETTTTLAPETTTTTEATTTTSTTEATTTTSTTDAPPPPPPPPVFQASLGGRSVYQNTNFWYVVVEPQVSVVGGGAAAGVVVVFDWEANGSGAGGRATCTTGANGRCEVRLPSNQFFSRASNGVRSVDVEIVTVDGRELSPQVERNYPRV